VGRAPRGDPGRGVGEGDDVTVTSEHGAITVPVAVTDSMVEEVVWLPTNSVGCAVRKDLLVGAGQTVEVAPASSAVATREGGQA